MPKTLGDVFDVLAVPITVRLGIWYEPSNVVGTGWSWLCLQLIEGEWKWIDRGWLDGYNRDEGHDVWPEIIASVLLPIVDRVECYTPAGEPHSMLWVHVLPSMNAARIDIHRRA